MGWTGLYRAPGMYSDAEFFSREFFGEIAPANGFVATASKNGVFYAVREIDAELEPSLVPEPNGKVRIAYVVLTKRAPKSDYNFSYKDMTEFSGPYETECPERLLKLLSPFRVEAAFASAKYSASVRDASRWRQACWANIAKAKNKIKLKPGMQVKLPKPVRFANGASIDTFMVEKRGGNKKGFVFAHGLTRYRLTKAMQLELQAA